MTLLLRAATLVAATGLAVPSANAAFGSIDSFAASAATVTAGDSVDFSVLFSINTSSWSGGGSNPNPPDPEEGYQTWYVNWYSYEHETLRSVYLQAGDQSFGDYPVAGPGAGYSNGWTFTMNFATPGHYQIDVSGGFDFDVNSGYSNESASRNCAYDDPDTRANLVCDGWTWEYSDADDTFSSSGGLSGGSLSIDVLAVPVPEPQTLALWLAGLGLIGLRVQSTRRRR